MTDITRILAHHKNWVTLDGDGFETRIGERLTCMRDGKRVGLVVLVDGAFPIAKVSERNGACLVWRRVERDA